MCLGMGSGGCAPQLTSALYLCGPQHTYRSSQTDLCTGVMLLGGAVEGGVWIATQARGLLPMEHSQISKVPVALAPGFQLWQPHTACAPYATKIWPGSFAIWNQGLCGSASHLPCAVSWNRNGRMSSILRKVVDQSEAPSAASGRLVRVRTQNPELHSTTGIQPARYRHQTRPLHPGGVVASLLRWAPSLHISGEDGYKPGPIAAATLHASVCLLFLSTFCVTALPIPILIMKRSTCAKCHGPSRSFPFFLCSSFPPGAYTTSNHLSRPPLLGAYGPPDGVGPAAGLLQSTFAHWIAPTLSRNPAHFHSF